MHVSYLNLRLTIPSLRSKLATVFKATRTHARNLALFAFIYKAAMMILRGESTKHSVRKGEGSHHALLAGLVGGYLVFGRGIQSSVNQQIVIYVFARVVLGAAKLLVQQNSMVSKEAGRVVTKYAWPVFAAASWGSVMWLFRWHPHVLQPSMRSSMVYM
jgi:hypothetical protein